jgi:hypothetical protein
VSTLEDMIKHLQSLPQAMTEEAAPRVADAIRAELARSVAAGTSPSGEKWAPRAAGGQALAGAMSSIGVAAVGSTVVVSVTGVEGRHHFGRVKGGKARPIIPTDALPATWSEVIERELTKCFDEWRRRA